MTIDRTPRPCLHPRVNHQHGTRECYWGDKCSCDPCRAANAAYARRQRKLAHSGRTPGGWTDAAPVRAHVLRVAAGWSQVDIAERLGWSRENLYRVIHAYTGLAVEVTTRRRVIDLYAQLGNVRPAKGPRRDRALVVAAAHGWQPPLAWDDDAIDNPAVRPDAGGRPDDVDEFAIEMVLDGQPMRLVGHDLEVAALLLSDKGLDYAGISARCRTDEATVRRVLNTARKRIDRAAAREDVA